MSAPNTNRPPSKPPITSVSDGDEPKGGAIWPITWAAVGAGVVTALGFIAAMFGVFDRPQLPQTGAPAVAASPTTTSATAEPEPERFSDTADVLPVSSPESQSTTTVMTEEEFWAMPANSQESQSSTTATTTKKEGRIVWDDESTGQRPPQTTHNNRDKFLSDGTPPTQDRAASSVQQTTETPSGKWWENDPLAPSATPLSPEDLYERLAPSVVTIKVKDDYGKFIGTGSGFFVDRDFVDSRFKGFRAYKFLADDKTEGGTASQYCYVLTNYHVIRPAVFAEVVLLDGTEAKAHEVIAEDESADLALLVVIVPANWAAKAIPLASDNPRVLATVYAIGSPRGLSGSASEGRVSGFRELPGGSGQWLQTTAPISPGSSGGPLLLTDGTLAGVTTLSRTDAQNLNFAVPVSKVQEFLSSKYRSRDIAEGASIEWHEYNAFLGLRILSEVDNSTFSEKEKEAAGLLQKAREQMREGRYDEAVILVRRVESNLPNEFRYLAEYIMGECSYHLAWEAYKKEHGLTNINRARYETTEQANDAVRHLKRSIELKPDFSPALESLVYHHVSAEDWRAAIGTSDALIKQMPRCAWAFNLRAKCYLRSKQVEPAISDLQLAIELGPNLGAPRFELGNLLIEAGEYASAIKYLESALELKHSSGVVHFNLGRAYQKSGQFERAISEYIKAKETDFSADFMCDEEIAKCQSQLR